MTDSRSTTPSHETSSISTKPPLKEVTDSDEPFLFLDLPPELQSKIYRHLIDDKVASTGRFNTCRNRWDIISTYPAIREADVESAIDSMTFCLGLRARAIEEWFSYVTYVGLVTCKAHSVRGRDSYKIPEIHTPSIESDLFKAHGKHLILTAVIGIDSLDQAFMFMTRIAERCVKLVTLAISVSAAGQSVDAWSTAEKAMIRVKFNAMKKQLLWHSKLRGLPDDFSMTLIMG
nr:hypothetical protein B0A51_00116 [Rachicladosporium sp. CCFEE 5018]